MIWCLIIGHKDGTYGVFGPLAENMTAEATAASVARPDVRSATAVPLDGVQRMWLEEGEWYADLPAGVEDAIEDFMWIYSKGYRAYEKDVEEDIAEKKAAEPVTP